MSLGLCASVKQSESYDSKKLKELLKEIYGNKALNNGVINMSVIKSVVSKNDINIHLLHDFFCDGMTYSEMASEYQMSIPEVRKEICKLVYLKGMTQSPLTGFTKALLCCASIEAQDSLQVADAQTKDANVKAFRHTPNPFCAEVRECTRQVIISMNLLDNVALKEVVYVIADTYRCNLGSIKANNTLLGHLMYIVCSDLVTIYADSRNISLEETLHGLLALDDRPENADDIFKQLTVHVRALAGVKKLSVVAEDIISEPTLILTTKARLSWWLSYSMDSAIYLYPVTHKAYSDFSSDERTVLTKKFKQVIIDR